MDLCSNTRLATTSTYRPSQLERALREFWSMFTDLNAASSLRQDRGNNEVRRYYSVEVRRQKMQRSIVNDCNDDIGTISTLRFPPITT